MYATVTSDSGQGTKWKLQRKKTLMTFILRDFLVSIEGSVKHIGAFAFAAWTYLTSISIGESVNHIGNGSFARCTSLTSISMGESVTHIGAEAFSQCTSLTSITFFKWWRAESGSRSLNRIITIPATEGRKRRQRRRKKCSNSSLGGSV